MRLGSWNISSAPVSGPQLPGQGSHYIAAWCAVGDELILGLGSKTAIISHCEIIPFLELSSFSCCALWWEILFRWGVLSRDKPRELGSHASI